MFLVDTYVESLNRLRHLGRTVLDGLCELGAFKIQSEAITLALGLDLALLEGDDAL